MKIEILFEGTYDECDDMEEYFIDLHGTFTHGLNMTNRGKGKNLSNKFNTLGYKFSESSRSKMSNSAKLRTDRPSGYTHTQFTKDNWSKLRKGKVWAPVKVDPTRLIMQWKEFTPDISDMESLACVTNKNGDKCFKNGRLFTYTAAKLVIFKKLKSVEYGVTPEAIKRIITNARLL